MNATFTKEIESFLLKEKERLENELAQFAHRNPQTGTTVYEVEIKNIGDEEGENASEVAQFGDDLSLEDALEKALRDVESALKQIKEGTYGICTYCKLPIDERRLKARPTSSSCIQCKKTLTQEV
ncbi:MAG TPA: TraR/DksA C4-type zinc finger protein [Patescibacteria group bacterium]|nr:TraR/DksA C4-type zinc finger protein [Patescibacteria group bacterium]